MFWLSELELGLELGVCYGSGISIRVLAIQYSALFILVINFFIVVVGGVFWPACSLLLTPPCNDDKAVCALCTSISTTVS